MNYRVWVGNHYRVFMMYDSVRDVMQTLRQRPDFVESDILILDDTRQAAFVASKKPGRKNFSWRC